MRTLNIFLEVIKNNKIKKLTLSNNFYKYAIKSAKKEEN